MDYNIDGNEETIEKAILHLYQKHLFTDVTLKYNPGNMKFYVHKLILSLYSPVLSDIFYGKSQSHTLEFEDVELSAVENMISFCYGEQLVFGNINQIKDTIVIASKYGMLELLKICLKELDDLEVDTSNVLTLLEMSMQNANKKKEKECLEVISRNQKTVFASEQFRKMKFENVCQIFENLREMGCLTEVQYLRSALEWMQYNDTECKDNLMSRIVISKLNFDEFTNIIISFPTFFTNNEIAKVFQKIKQKSNSKKETPEVVEEQKHTVGESGSTVKILLADGSPNVQEIKETSESEKKTPEVIPEQSHASPESETTVEIAENLINLKEVKETSKSEKKTPEVIPEQSHALSETEITVEVAENLKNLKICENSDSKTSVVITISDGKEGVKQAMVTTEDSVAKRGYRFYITGDLKDGLFLDLVSHGNGDYLFKTHITYESVHYFLRYVNSGKQALSPLNRIEVLKAAFYFGIQKVKRSCVEELSNIIDFDPAFLDGLLLFPGFEEKVTSLLISNTNDIILHPNFVNCSAKLIKIILSEKKLNVPKEVDLLIVTISWLEARKRINWANRFSLLNEIAFENVKSSDIVYVSKRYPKFFTESESRSIMTYKSAQNVADRKLLPDWYSFKLREYSSSYSEENLEE